jgi:hypothetical protein
LFTIDLFLVVDQVALQLPDELLENATAMVRDLEKRTGRSVFVLGDTSYGRCFSLQGPVDVCGVVWLTSLVALGTAAASTKLLQNTFRQT